MIDSFLPSHTEEESEKIKDEILEAYDLISKDPSIAKIPEVNYDELVRDDLGNRFKDNVLRHQVEADREKYSIDDLIKKCARTELAIPDFQRFFVWDKDQISAFFDSILNPDAVSSIPPFRKITVCFPLSKALITVAHSLRPFIIQDL